VFNLISFIFKDSSGILERWVEKKFFKIQEIFFVNFFPEKENNNLKMQWNEILTFPLIICIYKNNAFKTRIPLSYTTNPYKGFSGDILPLHYLMYLENSSGRVPLNPFSLIETMQMRYRGCSIGLKLIIQKCKLPSSIQK